MYVQNKNNDEVDQHNMYILYIYQILSKISWEVSTLTSDNSYLIGSLAK